MNFFKKHPGFIQTVIWITIIGFVAAYIPLLFVSSTDTNTYVGDESDEPISEQVETNNPFASSSYNISATGTPIN